ncbi:prephenate dehydrogenase [Corynebacterium uterequi]|uniref:Prephenate dehydrogenase n=1 Tax=Corynebacterium uterequi TaxID=1072256 RepID=A0A0G3H9X5_9CORY|nr:prephenate dehydrogenase [Corynebacterium uterequi]AKK10146.1 prephenate dehydrogenase [Corynebacterium uterequi]
MTSPNAPRPVCIIGLGLIGGSLLRDLAAAGYSVYGYNRSTSGARSARKAGFDVSDDLDDTLRKANDDAAIIVLAVPMGAVSGILDRVVELAPRCGITDVVSVKGPVYDEIRRHGLERRYVGGHPMAGTQFSGWRASKEGLFVRAAWVITYDYAAECEERGERTPQEWIDLFSDVTRMIVRVKAEAVPARVANHDMAVARVSHLPHVIASALSVVGDHGGIMAQSLAAGSFKDATRVAATDPALQRAMCESNAASLVVALDDFIHQLNQARDALDSDEPNIAELIEFGHRTRTRLEARSGARKESVSPVKISSRPVLRLHPGGPHWVRQLAQTEDIGGRIEIF